MQAADRYLYCNKVTIMKTILVPVDFSDASTVALKFAAELARVLKSTIKLLYITPNPPRIGQEVDENQEKLKSMISSLGDRYSSLKWGNHCADGRCG
jgi:nucleotide-binding universal stress UspA family protein